MEHLQPPVGVAGGGRSQCASAATSIHNGCNRHRLTFEFRSRIIQQIGDLDREAKSISNETTFAEDIADMEVLRAWLVELVEQVARRLRQHDIKGRTVELKVRFADVQTITRSMTLAAPTSITRDLLNTGLELLTKRLPARHQPIRLLGFGVSKLDGSGKSQQTLFDQPDRERHQELDRVADQITEKFGRLAIRRGTRLDGSVE